MKKIEDKVVAFWYGKVGENHFYDDYDYETFWKGRDYENFADQIAIKKLLNKISEPRKIIIDIGGGNGRIAPLYKKWENIIFLDPSYTQIEEAKKNIKDSQKIFFIKGSAESIPLDDNLCDMAICVRVFHYIKDARRAINEINRVIAPKGYLILEIPNKIHFKARIKSFFSFKSIASYEPISRSEQEDIPFLNHHPQKIKDILISEQFEIIEMLSVSNFRSAFLKKIFPLNTMLFFEKKTQKIFSKIFFGPSIYFLARKK